MFVVAAASVARVMSVVRDVTVSSAVGSRRTVGGRRMRTMWIRAGFRWLCTVLVFPMR
jgi:hypothetical protein